MKFLMFFLALAGILLLFSCKSNKHTPATFTKKMLTFGNMGGFAGTTNSYTLLETGQFFASLPRTVNTKKIGGLKKRDALQVFSNFQTLGIANMNIDNPGNLTYFIEYKNGEESKTLKWGGNETTPDPNLKLFYTNLMMLAREKSKEDNSATK